MMVFMNDDDHDDDVACCMFDKLPASFFLKMACFRHIEVVLVFRPKTPTEVDGGWLSVMFVK